MKVLAINRAKGVSGLFAKTHVWQCGDFYFEQRRPLIMGVLNVTPDSFSDGGRYNSVSSALLHAKELLRQGADIIDVGGESTRPGASALAPAEELERVFPVVRALVGEGCCVSVDSRNPSVIKACLNEGIAIINDVSGFTNPDMVALAAESSAGCVVMHMQNNPATMQQNPQYHQVVEEVSTFLLEQASLLEAAGVDGRRICVDPGPGFGKNTQQNQELLRQSAHFAALGTQPYLLMAAWSRKRYIGEVTGEPEPARRVAGSVAAALYAACQGAGVLRVHDVAPTIQALKIWEQLA